MKYFILFLLFLTFSCSPAPDPTIKARQGVLDLSTIDFKHTALLSGEWEFYWHKYYTPQDFSLENRTQDRIWAPVPGIFNNIIENNNGYGYATYRLQLILPEKPDHYAIYLKRMPGAYRLYFNGQLIKSSGIPGTNQSSTTPVYTSSQINLHDLLPTNELIIHVANYHDSVGGLWKTFLIGREDKVRALKITDISMNVAFLALFFFLSIYHLVQFLSGINKQPTLILGFLCLILGIRVFVMDEMLILKIFPGIYSRDLMKMEFMTFFSIIPLLHLFIYTLYKDIMSKTLLKAQLILSGVLNLIILLTPLSFYIVTMNPYKIVILLSLIYLTVKTANAVKMKIPGSPFSLTGILIFDITVIIDLIIFTVAFESHLNLTPYGMLGIVFFESITIFKQLAVAYKKSETLETKLRKSIAREQQINKMKNHFITHASHEFRTPLAVIQLSCETLERVDPHKLTEKKRENYFSQIYHSIRQITGVMDNILIMGRERAAHQKLNREAIELKPYIQNIIKSSFPHETRIVLKMRGEPFLCVIDPRVFQGAITNLLSNAVKFSPGHKNIEVYIQQTLSDVKITVKDFGIGIPEQDRDHIFEDFYRASNSSTIKGSGLGLAITRGIVEKHGGKINMETVPGNFTCFIITLPHNKTVS